MTTGLTIMGMLVILVGLIVTFMYLIDILHKAVRLKIEKRVPHVLDEYAAHRARVRDSEQPDDSVWCGRDRCGHDFCPGGKGRLFLGFPTAKRME